jgi:hypothetical protein
LLTGGLDFDLYGSNFGQQAQNAGILEGNQQGSGNWGKP